MNVTVFSTVYLHIPYKPLSALMTPVAKLSLGHARVHLFSSFFPRKCFCLIERLRQETMKILRIYLKKKSQKDYLNSLQSCVYVRPLYGVVHFS